MLDLADPSVPCATWIVNLKAGISCVAAILEKLDYFRNASSSWSECALCHVDC